MATAFQSGIPAQKAEERFFFKLACSIGLVLIAGFSIQLAAGRSSFAVPPVYHLHAAVFFGWVALFLVQSFLVGSGNIALHRRLGWLSAIWVPVMVVLAVTITVTSLRRTGGPFFFDANEFLFGNCLGALAFGIMVGAAVRMRRRTDWHRRLMIGAMAAITGPGWGRLLPTPLLIPYGWEITNTLGMTFVVVGMIRDKRVNGAVHPAWWVALAAGIGWIVVGEVLAYTPWAIEVTRQVMEGYPGAARPMEAYLP
ncbi:MAG: hypothetical protein ABL912_00520 [Novosphingobium sp.]